MSRIFDYFCKNVLRGKTKMSGHDYVEIFMGIISDKMDYYQHPSDKNTLVCNGMGVSIDGKSFSAFFSYFNRHYTPQEMMRLKSIADRLIEDAERMSSEDLLFTQPFTQPFAQLFTQRFLCKLSQMPAYLSLHYTTCASQRILQL